MKNAHRILQSIFLILLVFAATSASAETKVGPVSVSPSPGNDRYLNLTFDFTVDGKEYATFVTGITSDVNSSLWAPGLAERIAEHIAKGKKLRIATESTGRSWECVEPRINLIDAEKQNLKDVEWEPGEVPDFNSDSVLCWAAAASNALEISGWGQAMTARHPDKVNLQNVDDIFDYLDTNFTDFGFLAVDGYKWFINGANGGVNEGQMYDKESEKVKFGFFSILDAQLYEKNSGGLATEFCPASVSRRNYDAIYEGPSHNVTMKGLRDAADDLEKGYGVAMGISFGMGGHDLCLMGTVREKNGNSKGDVVAVFLADSDNDTPRYAYDNEEAAAKAGSRRNRVNSYEMYMVSESGEKPPREESDGEETGPNYNWDDENEEPEEIEEDEDWDAIIGDDDNDDNGGNGNSDTENNQGATDAQPVVYLMNFYMHNGDNEEISDLMSIRPYSSDLPKETIGTRDVYTSPDLVPLLVEINRNEFDSGPFMYVQTGEKMTVSSVIQNQSFVRLSFDDSADVTLRYHFYRAGTEVDTVMTTVRANGVSLHPAGKLSKITAIPYVFEKPGVYDIAVEIVKVADSKGNILEAYTQNNTLLYGRAYVAGTEEEPELPQTGDAGSMILWILLMIGSCGVMMACSVKKKEELK